VIQRIVIIFFVLAWAPRAYSQTASPSNNKLEHDTQIQVEPPPSTFPIGEEVKILRAERRKKMPYLDRGFVKETVNRKTVQSEEAFAQQTSKALQAVVERAVEVSTEAKAVKARISVARRRILVAGRELLPSFDFNFEFRNGSLSGDAFTGKDYHATFKLPVFRGGILWNTFLMEREQFKAAKKEYDAILNQIVDEVAKAYFEYNRAREVYEDRKKLTERAGRQYQISKEKHEQNLISEIEYLNVESMSGQLQYDMETIKQELELAKLDLQRYLKLGYQGGEIDVAPLYNLDELIEKSDPHNKAQAESAELKKLGLEKSLDEFVDLAYQNRPELQVEAAKLRASRLQEKVGRGALLPRVDLTMQMGELAEAFTRLSDSPRSNPEWMLGLEVSQNVLGSKMKYIFNRNESAPSISQFLQGAGSAIDKRRMEIGGLNGLQDYVDFKEAQVKKLEQVVELEKKEQEVIREVKEAYFDYHKASIQVESTLKRNQYRHRLVDLAKIRLDKAEIEISEYLQAEMDLAEERKKLHGALADLFKAKSKLNRAIGIRDFLPMEERYGV